MSIFKNIIVYRIGAGWTPPALAALEEALQAQPFVKCGPTQELSVGWVAPRGEDFAPFAEKVAGQIILKLAVERKSVPAGALKTELDVRCKVLEQQRGTKVGRKEKVELKEDIKRSLLPRAFSKSSAHLAWIDPENKFLVVGAGSVKASDQFVSSLVDLMADLGCVLPIAPLSTTLSPSAAMAQWLTAKEAPTGFLIERDVELKQPSDKSGVRYSKHTLELDEIVNHIADGKVPTKLALTFEGMVSFVLADTYALSKIVLIEAGSEKSKDVDNFEADIAIATGELSKLLPELLAALGGEVLLEV